MQGLTRFRHGLSSIIDSDRREFVREDAEKAIDNARKIHELSRKLFYWWKEKS
ncbi:MAG: hypothetical protein FGF51_06565 [Candidatus Brockarchaeota archaeon]|nr:hypothetical protein [Candidatus Brockarchaeota archaeon]